MNHVPPPPLHRVACGQLKGPCKCGCQWLSPQGPLWKGLGGPGWGSRQEEGEEGWVDSLTHLSPYILVEQEVRDTAAFFSSLERRAGWGGHCGGGKATPGRGLLPRAGAWQREAALLCGLGQRPGPAWIPAPLVEGVSEGLRDRTGVKPGEMCQALKIVIHRNPPNLLRCVHVRREEKHAGLRIL